MKIMVMGHGRHGKDTFCELFADLTGLKWASSSWLAAEEMVFPFLAPKYGYNNVRECYDDRGNHRQEWFDLIDQYNKHDPAKFSRLLFGSYDIYCGIRSRDELMAARAERLFDLSIWVDASDRLPPEPSESCTVVKDDADVIVLNNTTLTAFRRRIHALANALRDPRCHAR